MSNIQTTGPKTLAPVSNHISTMVEASDIEIPKVLLMQGLSDFVSEQRAAMGDFVDSLTAEKLGSNKTPVSVIPICMWKDFLITEKKGTKFEFKEVKPYNSETMHWREFEHREFTEGGIEHQRNLRMNFALMLERDATELGAFPYVISFQRTGIKCGKGFANFFLKAQTKGQAPWFYTLQLGAKLEKNDLGSYYVPSVVGAKNTTDLDTVGEACAQWAAIFAKGHAKIDERDTEAGAPKEAETRF